MLYLISQAASGLRIEDTFVEKMSKNETYV